MSIEDTELLKNISKKLDQLVVLMKLSNRELLDKYRQEIQKDEVSKKILDIVNEPEPLTSTLLKQKVAQEANVSDVTVERRIYDLVKMGILIRGKKGKEIYYESSELID